MLRTVIQIDKDKCDGCGLCANACHEGAIAIIDGKAKLVRDDFCDGFGDCLPACPTGAITFIEREAAAYDEAAVERNKREQAQKARIMEQVPAPQSELTNWPVQIKLAPPRSPFFMDAHLLIAADCCAFAYGNFHQEFIRNKTVLVGCPKLDMVDYTEKLTEIIANNDVKSVTICRMEVPCCGGLERAATEALRASGKFIPWQVVTFSLDGRILD